MNDIKFLIVLTNSKESKMNDDDATQVIPITIKELSTRI